MNGDWKLKERFDQPNVRFTSKGSQAKFHGISATKKGTGAWSHVEKNMGNMGMVLERYLIYLIYIHPGWRCSTYLSWNIWAKKQTPEISKLSSEVRCCGPGHPGHRPTPANGRRTRMAPRLPIRAR